MNLDLAAFDQLGTVPGTLDIDLQPGTEGFENLVDGELGAFVFDSSAFGGGTADLFSSAPEGRSDSPPFS